MFAQVSAPVSLEVALLFGGVAVICNILLALLWWNWRKLNADFAAHKDQTETITRHMLKQLSGLAATVTRLVDQTNRLEERIDRLLERRAG